ncbi:hypothetical protein PISMIDRAFT_677053, partial [Pisolithus microcarpus 441]
MWICWGDEHKDVTCATHRLTHSPQTGNFEVKTGRWYCEPASGSSGINQCGYHRHQGPVGVDGRGLWRKVRSWVERGGEGGERDYKKDSIGCGERKVASTRKGPKDRSDWGGCGEEVHCC